MKRNQLTMFTPACEIEEGDDYYLFTVSLPGVKRKGIRVEVQQNLLSISGEGTENLMKPFSRSVVLPPRACPDEIKAVFHDDILWINVPKAETVVTRRIGIDDATEEFVNQFHIHPPAARSLA